MTGITGIAAVPRQMQATITPYFIIFRRKYMKNITRRNFLKGTVAGAAALSLTGLGLGTGKVTEAAAEAAPDAAGTELPMIPAWTQMNPQADDLESATTDFAELFSPIQVGPMTLKNRIIKSAAGSDTMPREGTEMAQNTIDYYGRFADGGAALIILEDGVTGKFGINQFSKLAVETYEQGIAEIKKVADRVHEGGALIGTQVGIGNPMDPGDANAYTTEDLKRIVKGYGEGALRLKQAGFDCIELKGATNDGLNQFVTRSFNQREDEYGVQTEENRVRFFKEIVQEVRAQVGDDFGILVLINAMEENDRNLGANDRFIIPEEAQYLAKTLEEAGADLIQVRVATSGLEANCWATDTNHCVYMAHGTTGYGTQFDYSRHWAGLMDGSHEGAGAFIPLAAKIKEAVSVPVGCASVMDPRLAPDLINNAIRDGKIDVIFMTRALTVDPQLPNKLQSGRRDEVAPCMHCFHCHGIQGREPEYCRVNATTQFAYTEEMPDGYELVPADAPKKVMIIGGGPAGLEAARVAAARGHKVSLYEKSGMLGGMTMAAQAMKGNHERFTDLRAYFTRQMELLDVDVHTQAPVDLDTVKAENPDVVIVAVGGKRESRFSGDNVMGMDSFNESNMGSHVVILGANLQATDLAQYLIAKGKTVTIIHEGDEKSVDKEQSYWVRMYVKAHLYSHGVKIWNNAAVTGVDQDGVTIRLAQSDIEKQISADTVFECYDMVPDTALAEEIKAAGFETICAGCDAPSNIQTAIHAGHMAARYL